MMMKEAGSFTNAFDPAVSGDGGGSVVVVEAEDLVLSCTAMVIAVVEPLDGLSVSIAFTMKNNSRRTRRRRQWRWYWRQELVPVSRAERGFR